MTSKERAGLKAKAMKLECIFHIGKAGVSSEQVEAIRLALKNRELIKLNLLKNCLEDPKEVATLLAERTGAQVVQVIGRKIILYKLNPELEKKRKAKEKAKGKTGAKAKGKTDLKGKGKTEAKNKGKKGFKAKGKTTAKSKGRKAF